MVLDHDPVAGCASNGVGSSRSHAEERLEDLADRLAEALGGVLHARGLPAGSRSPTAPRGACDRGRACAPARRPTRSTAATPQQEDHRAVAGALERRRAPAASRAATTCGPRPSPTSSRVTGSMSCDDLDRQQAEQHAAGDQPDAGRRAPSGRRRAACASRRLARLAEEDDAEELDHRVAGQRGDQRDQRRDHRDQHVEERIRQPGVNRKLCSSSHSETKPFERRQPGAGQHADQRQPSRPRA